MKSNPTTPLVEISTDLTRLGTNTEGRATMLVLDHNNNGLRDTDEPTAFGINANQTVRKDHSDNRTDDYQSKLNITGAVIDNNLTGDARIETKETNRNRSGGIYGEKHHQEQSTLSNEDKKNIVPLLEQLASQ